MDKDCIYCSYYKRERDLATQRLADSLTAEEHYIVKQLRKEIREMQVQAERRNRELDAMHWIWCDGGCSTGAHRFDEEGPEAITQEIVDTVVRNTRRLQRWFINYQYKKRWEEERKKNAGP